MGSEDESGGGGRTPGARLGETFGAMLGFGAGASLGLLAAALLGARGVPLAGLALLLAAAGAVAVVASARRAGARAESDPTAAPHRFRPRTLAPYHGGLALGAILLVWGARGLARGQLTPALGLGALLCLAMLLTLRSRLWRRQVVARPDGLELREGDTVRASLLWEEVRRLLVDPSGSLFLDTGDSRRNLLLPAAGSPWATFHVTRIEELAALLRERLAGRVKPVDSLLAALRATALGRDGAAPEEAE